MTSSAMSGRRLLFIAAQCLIVITIAVGISLITDHAALAAASHGINVHLLVILSPLFAEIIALWLCYFQMRLYIQQANGWARQSRHVPLLAVICASTSAQLVFELMIRHGQFKGSAGLIETVQTIYFWCSIVAILAIGLFIRGRESHVQPR